MRRRRLVAFVLLVGVVALWRPASAHVRAAALLVRFADPDAHGLLAQAGRHDVQVRDEVLPAGEGRSEGTRARLYVPAGVTDPPGLVVVHGVHWKGIDEPRLQRFALTIAASGVEVLTPEIRELCDYRIDPASIATIGQSTRALSATLGGRRVGLMGLSFAGGLSLIAASDPRWADTMSFVVSVGGHDDLGRVLRFFASDEAPLPDGTTLHMHAHDYGPAVLVYSHVEDFFPPEDAPAARDSLRALLHEDFDGARELAKPLSPQSAAKMARILAHDTASLRAELGAEIARLEPEFAAVSPSAHLASLQVPAFVLHGAGDTVVPPSEAEWLARDIPRPLLRGVLVSRAIEHVELESGTGFGDELALVHFMSDVLDAADDEPLSTR